LHTGLFTKEVIRIKDNIKPRTIDLTFSDDIYLQDLIIAARKVEALGSEVNQAEGIHSNSIFRGVFVAFRGIGSVFSPRRPNNIINNGQKEKLKERAMCPYVISKLMRVIQKQQQNMAQLRSRTTSIPRLLPVLMKILRGRSRRLRGAQIGRLRKRVIRKRVR
jgi:hypothetical protein